MRQTWENGEKPNFGFRKNLIFARLAQNFFRGFYLYLMLDIVASYSCMQLQGKCMIQTQ